MASSRLQILDVFNRYRLPGGEEQAAARIRQHLRHRHEVGECQFSSSEWSGPEAPGPLRQAIKLFYNPDGRRRFEAAIDASTPDLAIFHNIFPVGSPALYHTALQRRLSFPSRDITRIN